MDTNPEAVHEHADTIDPEDRVDPSEFEDFDEVDSTTVDSSVGAPD